VTERLLVQRRETILDQTLDALSRYLEHRFLDGRTRRELEKILHLRQTVHDIDRQVEKLRPEQRELGERQDRLRMNLGIAATNEQEQQIRRRSADEFSRTQDREAEIERELAELKQRREQAEAELQSELTKL
jgi:predicted  nucleic acid-binding Zn-ribbon protein